jgi:hypothetical protein
VPFAVTPDGVQDAARSCDQAANDVLTQLGTLKTFVLNLVGEASADLGAGAGVGAGVSAGSAYQWMGVTAAQFGEMMNNVQVYSMMLHDALIDIENGLKGNFVNYVNSEADNLAGIQNIDNGLLSSPKINL